MTSEYTPTTEQVRSDYGENYEGTSEKRLAAFDRWLAAHDRRVRADAWDEGLQAGWEECRDPGPFVNDWWDSKVPNPYRREQA